MGDKLLTIIVPTYNMERYLDTCLSSLVISNSVLLQQLEVLVIIDGAIDSSSEIAHSYQDLYPNVFITIDKENGNYGSCINKGLQIATGKYVKVLDADDSFETANFEDYLRSLGSVDVDMVVTPYIMVDEAGKIIRYEKYDLPVNVPLTWKQLTPSFKKKSLQMHAVTYRRQNIIDIHYRQTEGISYTDQEWIFTPLIAVNSAIAYPNTIYKYLVGRQGQTINPQTIKHNISHNEQCLRRIISDYKSFGAFDPYKQEYIDYKFRVSLIAMYNWYLLRYPDLDVEHLVRLDDYVKSVDPSYIRMLDEQTIKHTHCHYIKMWHQNRHKRNGVSRLCYWYSCLVEKCSRFIIRILRYE